MNEELFNALIAPIPGDHPCGEDVSYLPMFDEIREARRKDDPALAQGEWETELKMAQWPKVRQLCEDILQHKSKDLQVGCWYVEAMTELYGFRGLAFAFQVIEVVVCDFWEFFYPSFDPDDLEERVGKIEWLNKHLPLTICNIPLTSKASGGYGWLKWNESRAVDNLGLKDSEAKAKAISQGKLGGDAFDKAASHSGLIFYEELHAQIQSAQKQIEVVEKHVDERFGNESPGLREVRKAVTDCEEVVAKLIARFGGKPSTTGTQASIAVAGSRNARQPVGEPPPLVPRQPVSPGTIRTRDEAVTALRHVSQFFRDNEPHSPVGLLAERAAKWAEMPLERWLASVIKDDSTLAQLRELLDVPIER